mgnify:FL=1
MKITSIKLNKNGKYVVTIDNEKYNLYQDTILKYLLFSKKEIDNTLFENIIKDNNFYDAYYKIIKFVSIRLRTENEIRKKLNTLFILKKDQDKIINKLKEQGYLNDELYIKSYINDKINLSLEGPEKVKRDLLKNGFNEEDILKYLCLFEDINEERINKIINKKLKANHNLSKKLFIVKVGNDLRNLGYTNYREILENIDFDDKDIYQKEYDKIYNKLIKKYPPEKADILTKQKLYTKGF